MSKSHFFKHLSYTLSRGSFIVSTVSNLKPICRNVSKPNSLLFANNIPISSFCAYVPFCSSHHTDYSSTATHTHSSASSSPSSSAYLSVRIRCPNKDVADMLSEALLCFGASSVSTDEQDDSDSSNEICMDSIFPECQDVDACLSQAADSVGLKKIPKYEVKMGEQYDWVRKTQESFLPVEVAEGLWIVPEWRSAPDVRATNIILNPGLAFGTGEHPTTKLCLLLLRELIKGGELFLDYGTGSGLLAIAALKFGAAMAVGLDVDPQAIKSARHNADLNNIGPETMELLLVPSKTCSPLMDERTNEALKDGPSEKALVSESEKYDVVIANILLNPLLDLADHIVSYAKPGAIVAVSGIISEQVSYIMDRYSMLLEDISVQEMDDWACVIGRKKNNIDGR
ncbi:ribosomal protein L11 methyltransferase [Ricinus communis]|uniref:ribosomal protein L11 methyltransferase n=1 Tax=Ricinus communis TaxID=3988 RepID=UPI00201ABA04|nr:ribosomal protein L11 methyltransferase [Ricinus communis]